MSWYLLNSKTLKINARTQTLKMDYIKTNLGVFFSYCLNLKFTFLIVSNFVKYTLWIFYFILTNKNIMKIF